MDSRELSMSILEALATPLNKQTKFGLRNCPYIDLNNVRMFILLTHIAESAVPSKTTLEEYFQLVERNKNNPSTESRDVSIIKKHGRTPMMDKIVRAKLRKIAIPSTFTTEFSGEGFPSQLPEGTRKARENAVKDMR